MSRGIYRLGRPIPFGPGRRRLHPRAANAEAFRVDHPRVLHLIGSLDRGGTEHQLVEFIRRSPVPERHIVAVFTRVGPLAELLPAPPVLVGPLGKGFRDLRDDLMVRRQLRRLIHDQGVDLVHAHLSMSELLAAACVPRATPIVASRRGRTLRYEDKPSFRAVEAFAHRRVRLMICNSEELARFTLSHDLSPPPVTVIPNGVDLERFATSPLPHEPVVAVVANLIWYKRHDLFLRGFGLAARRVPGARAILAGDGPERQRLEKLAAELGIAERVAFLGRLDDPRSAVSEARAVSLTSVHEGLPNALLEAMAMGRPIVATKIGGVPELVDDRVEGFLVGNDPVDIGDRLAALLVDDGTAETMGERARARAERFGWTDVVERTHEAYRRVLAGERIPHGRRVA